MAYTVDPAISVGPTKNTVIWQSSTVYVSGDTRTRFIHGWTSYFPVTVLYNLYYEEIQLRSLWGC